MDLLIPPIAFPERVHPDAHLLLWQVQGGGECRVGGVDHRLHTDQAIWVPAGSPHRLSVDANSVVFPLSFASEGAGAARAEVVIYEVTADLRLLCHAMMHVQSIPTRPDTDLAGALLARLDACDVETALPLPQSPAARRAAVALRLDPGDRRSARAWAAAGHVSVRTLERSFVEETGMTLREWRTACRISAARIMLRRGERVAAVARDVGYADPSAFGRAFRVQVGVTPGAYARA